MKKLILKIVVASALFLGLLPMLLYWRNNMSALGIVFILSIIGYGIAELVAASRHTKKHTAKRLCTLSNMLFFAILFLALGTLLHLYFTGSWVEELQIGFVMLAATYYSITLMQLIFLKQTELAFK